MRNKYKSVRAFVALCFIAGMKLNAQVLTGTVTINAGQATQLTTAPYNFQSFTAFAATVTANGTSGPLQVDVAANSGPYNEQIQLGAIPGVSAGSPITMN